VKDSADMGVHKPFSADFLVDSDHPTYLPQKGNIGGIEACRWMDESADHGEFVSASGEPSYSPETPMERFARDAEFAEQVEERVGKVLKKLESVEKSEDIDVFAAPSLSAQSILETVAGLTDALEESTNPMAFADNVWECLFHKDSQALSEVGKWWTACTTVVRVEDFFVPRDPAKQEQVALVTDVNPFDPNPNESEAPYAKLTVWSRGEPDVTLRKGDVVRVRNGKPGMYAGAFTLSAVYDTTMEIIKRGEGEAVTAADAENCTDRLRGERVDPEEGVGADRPDRPGFEALGTGRVPVPRYRRPEETMIAQMDFDDSSGVVEQSPGAIKYRSPTRLVDFHFPTWLFEDKSMIESMELVSDRILTAADLQSEEEFDAPDGFARVHESAMENAIDRVRTEAEVELTEREHPSIETVYEGQLGEDVVIRVYSTLVDEWAAFTSEEIRVVARNTETKEALERVTVPRRAEPRRWDYVLIDAVAEMVATLDVHSEPTDISEPVEEATDEDVREAVAKIEQYETVEPTR
jgi:hypothetical protein